MKHMRLQRIAAFLSVSSLAIAACSSTTGTDTDPPATTCKPDLESIQQIFQRSCAQQGCHAAAEPAAALDLVSPGLEARLVGVPAASCDGTRVVPGDPEQSFLYHKLVAEMPACGLRMPLAGALPAEELACIEQWIAALPSAPPPDAGPDAPSCETCGGATCVDVTTDPAHCGACNAPCAAGEVCIAGACAANCGMLDKCGGTCVDLQNDPTNCGTCGNACATGQTCAAGQCTCAAATVSFATDVQPIFTASCAGAGCHRGVMPQAGLDLSVGKSRAALVDVPASQCNDGRVRVLPGEPSQSYIVDKMMGLDMCMGTMMPKSGSVPTAQLEIITNWICAGAPDN